MRMRRRKMSLRNRVCDGEMRRVHAELSAGNHGQESPHKQRAPIHGNWDEKRNSRPA